MPNGFRRCDYIDERTDWEGGSSQLSMSSDDNRIYKGWIHFTVYYIMGNSINGPSKRGSSGSQLPRYTPDS